MKNVLACLVLALWALSASAQYCQPVYAPVLIEHPASLFGWKEQRTIEKLQAQNQAQTTAQIAALQSQVAQLQTLLLSQKQGSTINYHIYQTPPGAPQGNLPIQPPQQILPLAPPQQVLPLNPPQQILPIQPPQQALPLNPPQQPLPIQPPQQKLPLTPPQPLPIQPPQQGIGMAPPAGYQRYSDQMLRYTEPPRVSVTRSTTQTIWHPAQRKD